MNLEPQRLQHPRNGNSVLGTEEIGRRVRAARAYAGLTIGALADSLGMGARTIKRIECGERDARRYELIGIAEACGLPREFFELDFDLLRLRK
jgi:transcriptional regulator with XRE-family HTH domain